MKFYWFRYLWIGILVIMYIVWTIGVFAGWDEKVKKEEWFATHLMILLVSSLIYFIYTLLMEVSE